MELFNVYPSGVEKIIKLLLIVLIGAGLRFYRLSESWQFLGDQGRDALVWWEMLVNRDWPFIGPITSVGGFFLGPFYYYLMAPFFWLAKFDPLGPVYATALIGVLTVPAIFVVARRFFSPTVSYLAAGLYALAAIPIVETRSAWNPNPMPLVVLGLVYGFYQGLKNGKKTWIYFAAACLGLALQLHYMILFFGLFLFWQVILVWQNKRLRKSLLGSLIILVLLMLPLLLFEVKNRFLNTAGLIEYLTQHRYDNFNLWQNLKNLTGRSEEAIGMILGFGRTTNLIRTIITRLTILGVLIAWLKKPTYEFKLVSLWLGLSIVGVAFYKDNVPPYYLGFIFPAVFILTAWLLSQFKGKLILIRYLFIGLFLYFNLPLLYQTLSSKGNLNSVQKTSNFIWADIQTNNYQNYNLTLLDGTRDYKAMAFRFFLTKIGGRPLGIGDYPQTQVLYVISPYIQANVMSESIWEISSLQPATVSASWQFPDSENIYKIERL